MSVIESFFQVQSAAAWHEIVEYGVSVGLILLIVSIAFIYNISNIRKLRRILKSAEGFEKAANHNLPHVIGFNGLSTEIENIVAHCKDLGEKVALKNEELLRDRKALERQKREVDRVNLELEQILSTAAGGIRLVDRDFNVLLTNDTFDGLVGIGKDEIMGSKCYEVSRTSFCHTPRCPLTRILGGEERIRTEIDVLDHLDKQVPCLMTATPFRGFRGELIGMIQDFEDISELKSAEEAAKQRACELEKVNKELDSFVYSASHDLRAPLRAISSFATFMEEDLGDRLDAVGSGHLSEIRKGVDRMNRLIEDLLVLSRVSRIKNPYEKVDMQLLIDGIKERLNFDIQKNNVDFRIQGRMPVIECDRIKFEMVFQNLINNAIKFSSKVEGRVPLVDVGYEDHGDSHAFYVRDNGIGIAKQYHDQIFAIFKRLHTEKEYEGTGAGLTIVKRIVDDHGGRVWVDSDLAQGATFYFEIPKNLVPSAVPLKGEAVAAPIVH